MELDDLLNGLMGAGGEQEQQMIVACSIWRPGCGAGRVGENSDGRLKRWRKLTIAASRAGGHDSRRRGPRAGEITCPARKRVPGEIGRGSARRREESSGD